ncbi:MAG TPA: SEC-C metal-binding domain-containing protein [Candidatus Cloacimonadota bacterium]|nr:SEC-C metal-binding domain-containing protein [Candidatus Cloacimonadota bacterium]
MVRHWHNDGQPMVFNEANIGRNSLCPCGSGKKYKKCRMVSSDCQICKTCGEKMKLYVRKGEMGDIYIYKCEPCMKKQALIGSLKP